MKTLQQTCSVAVKITHSNCSTPPLTQISARYLMNRKANQALQISSIGEEESLIRHKITFTLLDLIRLKASLDQLPSPLVY